MLQKTLYTAFGAVSTIFLLALYNASNNNGSVNILPRPAPHYPQSAQSEDERDQSEPQIWVSMSLCYSKTTQKYGKSNYPYAGVTPLSILLWRHFLPEARVLLQVVHTEKDFNVVMEAYNATLHEAGAVVSWVRADGTDCVLRSQLQRLFAFEHPLVGEEDVVATVDVNAFVMTPKILEPVRTYPEKRVWVMQYYDTADATGGTGESFNQNVLTMRAKTWREIMEYKPGQSLSSWLSDRIETIDLDRNNTWYYDQWITTYGILKHGLCTAPATSGLWNLPGVSFDPDLDDTETCFHGRGFKDCNKDYQIRYQGCKWWHFYPSQTLDEHLEKFHELTEHAYNIKMQSPFAEDKNGNSVLRAVTTSD